MSDKIITIVRALNEEHNVERFVKSHNFSDLILIADGGSTDNTVQIAKSLPNVKVRDFKEQIHFQNGQFINHQGHHLQFLIDWAEEEGADWICDEDMDHEPTPELVRDGRDLLENNKTPFTFVILLYLWGHDYYFPEMNAHDPPDRFFAWRPKEFKVRMKENHWTPDKVQIPDPRIAPCLRLRAPYAVFHHSWETPELTRKKMEWNLSVGINYTWPTYGRRLEKLSTWQDRWR